MDKHKNENAVRTTVAILAICFSVLLGAAGVNTYASQAAQHEVQRNANGTGLGDARLSDGLAQSGSGAQDQTQRSANGTSFGDARLTDGLTPGE